MDPLTFMLTGDGSHTLVHAQLQETYHSTHGAVQESVHVFLENGLHHCVEKNQDTLSILEVGFGTGLNAFLTAMFLRDKSLPCRYLTLEKFPLSEDIWSALNYGTYFPKEKELFAHIHQAAWNEPVELYTGFALNKYQCDLIADTIPGDGVDLVYYDAFAPRKQPDMWALPVLKKVVSQMKNGAILVTYCASGQFKRDLKTLGLSVETLDGPPGKKEMVRATNC